MDGRVTRRIGEFTRIGTCCLLSRFRSGTRLLATGRSGTINPGVGVDINSLVALSGTLAAVAALTVAAINYFQLKHSRFSLGVDLLLRLEATFDGPEMKAARSQAAKALKCGTETADLEPVLDFFETVGALVRRRALDPELAWSSFSYWVTCYAAIARDRIQARRSLESDHTYYEEFEFLAKRFTQVEIKKRHLKSPPSFSLESIEAFLEEETAD